MKEKDQLSRPLQVYAPTPSAEEMYKECSGATPPQKKRERTEGATMQDRLVCTTLRTDEREAKANRTYSAMMATSLMATTSRTGTGVKLLMVGSVFKSD